MRQDANIPSAVLLLSTRCACACVGGGHAMCDIATNPRPCLLATIQPKIDRKFQNHQNGVGTENSHAASSLDTVQPWRHCALPIAYQLLSITMSRNACPIRRDEPEQIQNTAAMQLPCLISV